ncbi:hypothetical protein BYT27DRAFT_7214012 [Phlegmacium glaucopus]|nr:hypothetical protein BYT27DRAFT_7214012 [Phlegmacium glaucopus]
MAAVNASLDGVINSHRCIVTTYLILTLRIYCQGNVADHYLCSVYSQNGENVPVWPHQQMSMPPPCTCLAHLLTNPAPISHYFYTSSEEVVQSSIVTAFNLGMYSTGADIEMIFADGGEEEFVGQMVEESECFQTRCKWYTSMIGKMSSVTTIVQNLRKRSIVNYAITEFVQGQMHRWAVGWSFFDMHLPDTFLTEIFVYLKVYLQLTEIQDPSVTLFQEPFLWKLKGIHGLQMRNIVIV